eukprot:Phypoly_transcript_31752.p1 GENE.Phypoly_transcript_31752~~Phypoly_transcript_31752.p1  ORF type:complete len:100 (+),score=3.75 Phypoly_transcript_31752:43-342(+)
MITVSVRQSHIIRTHILQAGNNYALVKVALVGRMVELMQGNSLPHSVLKQFQKKTYQAWPVGEDCTLQVQTRLAPRMACTRLSGRRCSSSGGDSPTRRL